MKLHYRKYGQGKPIIILHGLLGNGDNWVSLSRKLSADFTVYVPDFRNHGLSPQSEEFSLDVLVKDIHAFILDHQIENPIVLGHSMGGKVAMEIAFRYPEIIAGLIVVDVGLKSIVALKDQLALLDTVLTIDASAYDSRKQVEELIQHRIASKRLRLFLLKNLRRTEQQTFVWKIHAKAIKENLENIIIDIEPKITFTKPTLFIKGGASPYLPDAELPYIEKYFDDIKIETIPGASHWVHADKPEVFYSLVHSFSSQLLNA